MPLSDTLVLSHLRGELVLGGYPLFPDNRCQFVASDQDNHDGSRLPLEDVRAYAAVCGAQEFPLYVFSSRSGEGYHPYIFFETPVPAWKARCVALALLREAGVIGTEVTLSSFDRLFPNQDELNGKGFGNLIALPFQGQAAKQGHTLLLNPNTGFTKPYRDQWTILSGIERVPETRLDQLIERWSLSRETSPHSTGPEAATRTDEGVKRVLECLFIQWCKREPRKVSEPLWYALISNPIRLKGGYGLTHEYSRGYPGYSRTETDDKIHQAMDACNPHTCNYIRENGFKCKRDCGVRSPAALAFKHGDASSEPEKRARVSFG